MGGNEIIGEELALPASARGGVKLLLETQERLDARLAHRREHALRHMLRRQLQLAGNMMLRKGLNIRAPVRRIGCDQVRTDAGCHKNMLDARQVP